jgi:DNA-binding MarR family transcriptional regulator
MDMSGSFGDLLQHVAAVAARRVDQVLQERLGVGLAQFRLLKVLEQHPEGLKQCKIAQSLGQTEASISRQIKLLMQKGMLAAQISPANRRQHIAILTPKGTQLTCAAQEILQSYYVSLLAGLSEKQRRQVIEAFDQIHIASCAPAKLLACARQSQHEKGGQYV